ncbi:hypothetical protein ACJX0J_000938 (mitochondrion) [Zea mays]
MNVDFLLSAIFFGKSGLEDEKHDKMDLPTFKLENHLSSLEALNGKEGDPDSLLPIEDYRIWLQAPVLLIMSRLEVICSKLLGKFLLGFHFHDLPKDILFFLILILVFRQAPLCDLTGLLN